MAPKADAMLVGGRAQLLQLQETGRGRRARRVPVCANWCSGPATSTGARWRGIATLGITAGASRARGSGGRGRRRFPRPLRRDGSSWWKPPRKTWSSRCPASCACRRSDGAPRLPLSRTRPSGRITPHGPLPPAATGADRAHVAHPRLRPRAWSLQACSRSCGGPRAYFAPGLTDWASGFLPGRFQRRGGQCRIYGLVILSFMAGVIWGLRDAGDRTGRGILLRALGAATDLGLLRSHRRDGTGGLHGAAWWGSWRCCRSMDGGAGGSRAPTGGCVCAFC